MHLYIHIRHTSAKFSGSRPLFLLIGLRQAKVDGIHANSWIRHGIVSGGRRFRPRFVRAVQV